jgi:hypothetical protein
MRVHGSMLWYASRWTHQAEALSIPVQGTLHNFFIVVRKFQALDKR